MAELKMKPHPHFLRINPDNPWPTANGLTITLPSNAAKDSVEYEHELFHVKQNYVYLGCLLLGVLCIVLGFYLTGLLIVMVTYAGYNHWTTRERREIAAYGESYRGYLARGKNYNTMEPLLNWWAKSLANDTPYQKFSKKRAKKLGGDRSALKQYYKDQILSASKSCDLF